MATAPQLRRLVLQPTPFCNINCQYCYLPDRASRARMSIETLELVCTRVFESPWLGNKLEVAWHAGEPLTVPLAWYQEGIALMAERCPPGLALAHRFQTNGLLLNNDWARFLARIGARVGLSIDGPADLHDAARRTRSGHGTHAGAMQAMRLLQEHGVAFDVITVLTKRSLADPDRMFDFYVENGVTQVGFNVEEIEGAHLHSSLVEQDVEMAYRRFMRRFFERVCSSPGLLTVRELTSTLELLFADGPVEDEQNVPFAIVSIAYDGTISTFSPELLGTRHDRFPTFGFGAVATNRLCDLEHTPVFQNICAEIQGGVAACGRGCPYFRWCGGGAPANKLFEIGRFDATETMHCRLTRQVLIDEALAAIEAYARNAGQAKRVSAHGVFDDRVSNGEVMP